MMVVEPMVMGFFFFTEEVVVMDRLTRCLAAARPVWLRGVSHGAPSSERTQPSWPREAGKII